MSFLRAALKKKIVKQGNSDRSNKEPEIRTGKQIFSSDMLLFSGIIIVQWTPLFLAIEKP